MRQNLNQKIAGNFFLNTVFMLKANFDDDNLRVISVF